MAKTAWDYSGKVYAASFPQFIDGDGKRYFIFQLLNQEGAADKVFYREVKLAGSKKIMKDVVKAYATGRSLKVMLVDPKNGMRVEKTALD